ncbi:MAG: gluconate 2-dehydrogenase subunit 3 family protein [Gemmatimonadaceae bacterium]
MNRRELLQIVGGVASLEALSALAPQRLLALGEEIHRSAAPLGSADHPAVIAALAERILPESDTPGALAVGVPAFIEVIIHHWMSDEERTRLENGLTAIDAAAQARFKSDFADLTSDQQNTLITEWDATGQRAPGSAADAYGRIKDLSIYGYFTSKPVVENVLQLRRTPGRYNGCIPV